MVRQRYRWVDGEGLVEVAPDALAISRDSRNLAPATDLYMDGIRATDGADIGSRRKRREYMRRNGLCDADDMGGQWGRNRVDHETQADATRKLDVARTIGRGR